MIWSLEGGRLEPLLPLHRRFIPEGDVRGLPASPAMVCRIVETDVGYETCCTMPLPTTDTEQTLERLRVEWLRLQRHCFPFFWEDLLCYRGELLYRSACEWGWLNAKEEVIRCWHG